MNESTKQLHQQADLLLDSNNLTAAYSVYQQICELNNQDAVAFMMMGALGGEMGKIDEGMRNLEQAIKINPEYPDAYNILAQLYSHQGEFKKALESAKKAVEYDPHFFEAWSLLASLNGQLNQYSDAEHASKKALALDSSLSETRLVLANALMEQDKNVEALAEFKLITQDIPGNAHVYSRMGAVLTRLQNYTEAIPTFEKALKIIPKDIATRKALAYAYTALEDYEPAAEQYKMIIDSNPDDDSNWQALVTTYNKLDDWKSLALFCEQQAKTSPNNKHIIINQGYAQEKLGQLENAKNLYIKATELYPDWGDAWNRLGLFYLSNKDFDGAATHLKKAIDLGVTSPFTLCMYGYTLRNKGLYEESEKICKQALELAPDLAEVYLNIGSAQALQGKYDEALEMFNTGLSKNPEHSDLITAIADIKERTGKID